MQQSTESLLYRSSNLPLTALSSYKLKPLRLRLRECQKTLAQRLLKIKSLQLIAVAYAARSAAAAR